MNEPCILYTELQNERTILNKILNGRKWREKCPKILISNMTLSKPIIQPLRNCDLWTDKILKLNIFKARAQVQTLIFSFLSQPEIAG